MPKQTDGRHQLVEPGTGNIVPAISVLVREGFVVGHDDRFKIPAWVSQRWTKEDLATSNKLNDDRPFAPDSELPDYARAQINYENARTHMERGHMARQEDNWAFGQDNVTAGCLMSNIAPQHQDMNGEAWLDIENFHRNMVGNSIPSVWIISGSLLQDDQPQEFIGNNVGLPFATYKVLGWFDKTDKFHARGFIVRQTDRTRDPKSYLRPIREIEEITGLDFFPDLPEDQADAIETKQYQDILVD